jgi:cellulose biosynthesis protein BcsQ
LGFVNLVETIKTFRSNCPDPHEVKILGVVFTQVLGDWEVEDQAMHEVERAAGKEGIPLFNSQLKHSKSFIRSVRDQTPIFETLYAHQRSRSAAAKIADEMKIRIIALSTGGSSGKGKAQ